MKTPREILLARHRTVKPKLDAIRQEAESSRRCQSAETTCPRIDLRGCTGKCHPAPVSGTGLAVPPDLGGPGRGMDYAFHLQCFAAGQIGTGRAKIAAALAGNDSDIPAAGKIAGRADWSERTASRRTAETIFAATQKRRTNRDFDHVKAVGDDVRSL